MKDLNTIELKFQRVNQAHRDFNIANADFPMSENYAEVKSEMSYLPLNYKNFVKRVMDEDQKRCLYSRLGASTENVDLPKFSGTAKEDFFTFENKLRRALENNQVSKQDRIEKLRSCLSGLALSLVPERATDFEAS